MNTHHEKGSPDYLKENIKPFLEENPFNESLIIAALYNDQTTSPVNKDKPIDTTQREEQIRSALGKMKDIRAKK
jgi:hypothetical protein